MEIITYELNVALDRRGVAPVIDAVQGEEGTRKIAFSLFSQNQAYAVPSGSSVLIRYRKPDGTGGIYDTLPSGDSAYEISGNVVTITLAPQVLTASGTAILDAVLSQGEQILGIFPVKLSVSADPSSGVREDSANYFSIAAVNAAYAELERALQDTPALVKEWLTDHPEATTTVQEGSIDLRHLADAVHAVLDQIPDDIYVDDEDMLFLVKNGVTLGTGVKLPSAASGFNEMHYDQEGYLHLQMNGVDVVDPVLIGTIGGSGSSSVLKIQNTADSLVFAVVAGQPAVVKYNWSSVDDTGASTGPGTVQYIVNGVVKSTIVQVPQGEVSGDVSAWLESGVNSVQVKVTDSYGASRLLTYSIQAVSLSVSSTFDYVNPVSGALEFRFVASGSAAKTIHFELDGTELETMSVATSGKTSSYTIPAQSHGAHILQVWASAVVDGLDVKSNVLRYAVMWLEDGNTAPIIASAFHQTEADEGDTLVIPYVVYDPANETTAVTLKEGNTVISNLSVGRTEQTWSVRANNPGDAVFSITCGDTALELAVTVSELDIDVSVAQTDLMLELTAEGRSNAETTGRNEWKSGDVAAVLSGFNFKSNGWVADDGGNTVLRVDSGASVEIPYNTFATDARSTGRTIEIDFATRAVQSAGSTVISCLQGNVGFTVGDQSAMVRSEAVTASVRFKEEERLHVVFALESSAQDRFIYVYINGILSGVSRYGTDDNIQQGSPVGISIGSDVCGIDIYGIRIYDTCLTTREVLDNYMAGLPTARKREKYMDNNILNDGNVAYNAVMERLPVMIVTGELPPSKGEKKIVSTTYVNRVDSSKNFTHDGVTIDVQGTSSQGYPKKNYKIKLPEEYEHITGHIPEKTFTLKTDYMESAGKHNTQAANFINGLYSELTPPQQEDSRVRTTIAGFPFVLFHAAQEGDTPQFVGKYNFNNDKGNSNTLGLTDPNVHQRWEVCNNISDRCMFLDPDFSHGDITKDFEASYPDPDDKTPDYTALQQLAQWIYDTKDDPERFTAEVEEHFNLHYLLVYAVVSEFLGAMDSRTKNMFLQTWDRQIWYPVFYDIDTILGLNNEGHNTFGYDMEWQDGVWNGSGNALWNSVENVLGEQVGETYRELRSSGKLTYEKLLEAFDGAAAHVSEALYNEDAEFKYVGPMMESGTDYLYAAQGSRESHRKWWLYNRFQYMDAKYHATGYKDDLATMRLYTEADGKVVASGDFNITMYADGYASVMYGANGTLVKERGSAGDVVKIAAPNMTFSDTETFIYGASRISSLGDLSNKYADTVDVSKAVRLKELILGSGVSGYENPNLKSLTVTNNTLLEKLDVRGCSALAVPLGLTGCANIRQVFAQNSAITGVSLPVGGRLEEMYLPATITGLTVRDHPSLHTLEIAGYDNLGTIRLENCGSIDTLAIVKNSPNVTRLRVLDVNWTGVTAADLNRLLDVDGLDEAGNNTTMSVITGTCQVDSCSQSQLNAWKTAWPNLKVTTDNLLTEYTVQFVNPDGTVLDEQIIPYKGDAVEPIAAGRISTPVQAGDAQYSYTFDSWYGSYTNVTENRVVTATYIQTVNTYTVRLINGDTQLYSTIVEYGSSVVYDGAFPEYSGAEDGDWLFSGWSEDLTFIVGETNAYAQFEKLEVPAEVMTLEDMSWAQILAVARAGAVDDDGDWAIDGTKWFAIGDEKNITLSDGEELTLQIWDFNHDQLASGTGMAPITFGLKNLLANKYSFGGGSYTNWATCTLRTSKMQTIQDMLPAAIGPLLCSVNKQSFAYTEDGVSEVVDTVDVLFIPAIGELTSSENNDGSLTSVYPIFTDDASRIKYLDNGAGEASYWLTRTKAHDRSRVRFVMNTGLIWNAQYGDSNYVCFGFCIA